MPDNNSSYADFSDEDLMRLVRRADQRAFTELYDRYSRKLINFFFRMLGGNEAKAQDFVQDLFVKVIEKPFLFNPRKSFSTWIFSIAYNLCKNEYRRLDVRRNTVNHGDFSDFAADNLKEGNSLDARLDEKIIKELVYKQLQNMSTEQRSAFVLRFQENLSIKEISKIMGCSIGTVKSRLYYTTQKLIKSVDDSIL